MKAQSNASAVTVIYTVRGKLQQWFLFGVCFGLLPFALRWAITAFSPAGPPTLLEVFGDGELFIVSVALAATALSDVVAARQFIRLRQTATFASAMAIVIGSALYGIARTQSAAQLDKIVLSSAIVFGACVTIGAAATLMKEA